MGPLARVLCCLLLAAAWAAAQACATCGGSHEVPCPACHGKTPVQEPCPACEGSPRITCPACNGDPTCPCCKGAGRASQTVAFGKVRCNLCNGKGKFECRLCKGKCKVDCLSCNGTGKHDQQCALCGLRGKVPCPDCAPADKCPTCLSSGKQRCAVCLGTGTLPRPCEACKGVGRSACATCKGRGCLSCPTCSGSGRAKDNQQGKTTSYATPCPDCGGFCWVTCRACADADVCPACNGKGAEQTQCWGCLGQKDVACRRCAKSEAWSVVEPASGATVWIVVLDTLEPPAAAGIAHLRGGEKVPVALRLFVDARAATASLRVGGEGWELQGASANLGPVPLTQLYTPVPPATQDALKKRLPAWGVAPSSLTWPVTAAKGTVETRLAWTLVPGIDLSGGFKLHKKGATDLPLQVGSMTGTEWLRLIVAASKK